MPFEILNTDEMLETARRIQHTRDIYSPDIQEIPTVVCTLAQLITLLEANKALTTDMMEKVAG